jgi:hypothetical protein
MSFRLLVAAVLAPVVVVSGYMLCIHLFSHESSHHSLTPAFVVGIALGGWFVLMLPVRRIVRVLCLLVYVPLTWVLLIPYSLWFIAVAFHGMISGG